MLKLIHRQQNKGIVMNSTETFIEGWDDISSEGYGLGIEGDGIYVEGSGYAVDINPIRL